MKPNCKKAVKSLISIATLLGEYEIINFYIPLVNIDWMH